MSTLTLNPIATPNTPSSGKRVMFLDTADGRMKAKDSAGAVWILDANSLDRNLLINGGFDVNQRVADALTNVTGASTTARVYTADRWHLTTGNATTPQFQRVDTIAATETGITARFYSRVKQLTNAAKIAFGQSISGDALGPLRGRNVRFQCKARWSAGANRTMRLGLVQLNSAGTVDTLPATFISAFGADGTDPTLGTNLAYIAPNLVDGGTISGNAMNFTLITTWARYSATFTVPSNCVNLIPMIWSNAAGSASDDFLFTELGLYDGNEIRDWMPLPPSYELVRCQRYFSKSFPQGTAPAQNAGVNGTVCGIVGKAATALGAQIMVRWPQTMHKSPTVTTFNPSVANAAMRRIGGTAADETSTTVIQTTDAGCVVQATDAASGAVGDLIGVHYTADADI